MLRRLILILIVLCLANLYVAISFYRATRSDHVWWIFALIFIFQLLMPLLRFRGEIWSRNIPWLASAIRIAGVLSLMMFGAFSMLLFFSALRDLSLFISSFFILQSTLEQATTVSIEAEIWLTVVLLFIGLYQALVGPGIRRVQITLKGLPKAFEGFRIVQISDLHIGPTIRTSYVQNVVRVVNELKADLVALTGDITDGSPAEIGSIAKELSQIKSEHGRFFVTGNHEYYHDALGWVELHKKFGTHVLMNESHLIQKQGAQLAVLGVADVSAHHFVPTHLSSPEKAAANVPDGVLKILLAHQPASYKAAHSAGVNLQLSGHTHSGQFFPWNLVIGFFHDYYRGLNRFQDMWIYVNPGTGYWGPPLRTAVASEITLLTLTSE